VSIVGESDGTTDVTTVETVTTTGPVAPVVEFQARRAWLTLFITSISMFLVSMDVTIVSVALPNITREFSDTSAATLSWVFTAYNVTFAALLLLAGKLGDRWGRKRAFQAGLVMFLGASTLAALAPTSGVLIGARTLQAGGSALIYPASLALLLLEFPSSRRSMAIGVWGGIAGLGAALGPTLGAMLVEWAGWRWVFFINVPFVLASLISGAFVLRESKGTDGSERFDPIAVPLAAISVGLLVLGVVQGGPWGWTDPKVIASFLGAAVLFPIFIYRSAHHPHPLLDLDLFRLRSFSTGCAAQALFVGSFFGWLVLMPSFLEDVWGYSPLATGFALALSPVLSGIVSPIAGRAADRIGHRELVAFGSLASATGIIYWIMVIGTTPAYWTAIVPGSILMGIGGGTGFAVLTGAIMRDVPVRFYSMAGAARSTIFQLGSAIGIAVAVALVGTPAAGEVAPYARTWAFGALGAIGCAVIVLVAYPKRRPATEFVLDAVS
jgi:EmrB/QacA subfamily drug resistance transporter